MQTLRTFTTVARGPYAPGEIVLRKSDDDKTGCPFVTHFHNTQSGGYCHGHYFDNEMDANDDFDSRVLDWVTSSVFGESSVFKMLAKVGMTKNV